MSKHANNIPLNAATFWEYELHGKVSQHYALNLKTHDKLCKLICSILIVHSFNLVLYLDVLYSVKNSKALRLHMKIKEKGEKGVTLKNVLSWDQMD